MRLAGILTMVASSMVALVFLLLPATVEVLGIEASCGVPVWRVVDGATSEAYSELGQECYDQSLPRVFIGAGLLVVGGTAGVLMLVLGRQED